MATFDQNGKPVNIVMPLRFRDVGPHLIRELGLFAQNWEYSNKHEPFRSRPDDVNSYLGTFVSSIFPFSSCIERAGLTRWTIL
jgi:hypothetical protein